MSSVEQGCLTCRTVLGLRLKIQAGTPKSETSTEAQSCEPLQNDVDNLVVKVSFSLDEETIQQICSNPDPETGDGQILCGRGGIASSDLTDCVDANALGCDVQG